MKKKLKITEYADWIKRMTFEMFVYLTSSKSQFTKIEKSNNERSILLQSSNNSNSTNFQTIHFFMIQISYIIFIFSITFTIFTLNVFFLIKNFSDMNVEKNQIRKLIDFETNQNFRIDNIQWIQFIKFFH